MNLRSSPPPRVTHWWFGPCRSSRHRRRSGTLKRYLTYTLQLDGPTAAHYHWTATRLAGRSAEGAVAHPPTEGGVSQAVGVYVVGVGKHVIDLTMRTQMNRAPRSLAQFPAVYRQIVASWRFK